MLFGDNIYSERKTFSNREDLNFFPIENRGNLV